MCIRDSTLLTTTIVGVVLAQSFQNNRPLDFDQYLSVLGTLEARPLLLLDGLAFSITLMTILLAHELGHYFACRYYGIDASLPYFLPFPSPIGTLGAFIRIRSPIYTRQALFDVGIAGPLAGFVVLVPALIIGIASSKVVPGIAERGDLTFGVPAIQRALEWLLFPGVRSADILLHPVARAAWVGILATALNLPVSYTHLDVYKRQIQRRTAGLPTPANCANRRSPTAPMLERRFAIAACVSGQ